MRAGAMAAPHHGLKEKREKVVATTLQLYSGSAESACAGTPATEKDWEAAYSSIYADSSETIHKMNQYKWFIDAR